MEKHTNGVSIAAKLLGIMIPLWVMAGVLVQPAIGQDTVSGQVTDVATGESLPGVNVIIQGTARGVATNIDGRYELEVESLQDTLMFSFVGYLTRQVPINGRTTIDVGLQTQAIAGEELVVTGYSAQKREDITSAVSSVDIDNMQKQTSASVLQRLDSSVPGVTVQTSGSPGARNTVRIRGISSFQNNDPLYIIDGTPIVGSYLNFINPGDIASMQVLKDASAASIYGSRANNGVIIIETAKGGEGSGTRLTINARTGIANPIRGYNDFVITDALQYHEVVQRSYENAGEPVPENIYGDPDNPSVPNYIWPNDGSTQTNSVDESTYSFPNNLIMPGSAGTDWWDAVFDPALIQDYNIGVSGGGTDYSYNVSFNFLDQEGTAAYNHYQRGSIRVNTQFDAGILTLGENISVSMDENVGGIPNNPDGYAEDGIIGKNILMQPVVPVYDIAGNFASGKAVTLGNQGNPLKAAWQSKDSPTQSIRMFGNIFGTLDLMDNLSATSRFGFNLSETAGRGFNPITPENSEPGTVVSISEFNNVNTEWTWSNTVNFTDTFAENHNLAFLVGQEANAVVFRGLGGSMAGLLNTDPSSRYIQDALGDPDTKNVSSSGFRARLLSFFGKLDYNYDGRYYLSATLRRDGSSRLGEANKWGTFPAFSVGWRASNESFLQGSDLISNLMIRAGYGITGNQSIPAGSTVNQYGGGVGDTFYNISGDGSSVVQGFRQTVRGNPDLKWEENESINVGLDLELLEGKYSFALDVYQRDTNDLLFAPQLPATAGVASPPVVNIGQMRNTGFDLTVGTRGTIGSDATWSLSLTGSHYLNEIRRIDGTADFFFAGTTVGRHGFTPINQLGNEIGTFYGLQTDGLFMNWDEVDNHATQDGAAPGRIKYVDTNGDGTINAEDRTLIGSPHPDFTGGLDFSVQYKNWDFSTTFFASIGNEIYDVQKEFYIFRTFSTTVREDVLSESAQLNIDGPAVVGGTRVANAEVTNPGARYPRIDLNDTFSGGQPNDFFVEDGSYLRMRNIQIGYTLPDGIIPRLRRMRVYISGQNLFTLTGYDGLDPALPAANISNSQGDTRDQYFGIDRGAYPTNRIISIGIDASF